VCARSDAVRVGGISTSAEIIWPGEGVVDVARDAPGIGDRRSPLLKSVQSKPDAKPISDAYRVYIVFSPTAKTVEN